MRSTCVAAGSVTSAGAESEQRTDIARAFAEHGRGLYRYFAVRTGGDAHRADDLMQQLWLRARQSAASVDGDRIEFWLRAVARNLIREHWRKQAAAPRHVPMAEPGLAAELADRIGREDLPDRYMERKEVQDQLTLAVTELSTAEQGLIVAHYFHGESAAALADRLGVSQRTVERRLQQSRRSLRRKLESLEA